MTAPRHAFILACAATLVAAHSAAAQVISGTVVMSGDSSVVVGAVVLALDPTGSTRGRTLTDDRGHFSVRLTAGIYTLRTMRVGLRARTTGPLSLSGDTTVVIVMTPSPATLPAVTTREESQCSLRPDSALALGALWEDAKTALLAAAITREKSLYRFDLLDHVRTYEIGTGNLRSVITRESSVYDSRTWASLPPERLRREGYVIDENDTTVFIAPDIETLLSPYFIDTHCFRIAETPGVDSAVAIEFIPARDYGHAEVRGRLWIDKQSHELRSLDFHYVRLEAADSLAGGSVDFARLPTGAWVMTDWSIRAPVLRLATEQYVAGVWASRRRTPRGYAPMIVAKHEVIAEQLRVTGGTLRGVWRDNQLIWAPRPRGLAVHVTSGSARRPPSGDETVVYLVGTPRYALADTGGTARFDHLVHGAYLVDVGTKQLDVLGWPRAEVRVDLERSPVEDAEVNLAEPMVAARVICGDDAKLLGDHTGVLIGAVTRGGEPVGHRDVTVSWTSDARPGTHAHIESRTFRTLSGDGRFMACGVPRDRELSVHVDGATESIRIAPNEVVGILNVALKS